MAPRMTTQRTKTGRTYGLAGLNRDQIKTVLTAAQLLKDTFYKIKEHMSNLRQNSEVSEDVLNELEKKFLGDEQTVKSDALLQHNSGVIVDALEELEMIYSGEAQAAKSDAYHIEMRLQSVISEPAIF